MHTGMFQRPKPHKHKHKHKHENTHLALLRVDLVAVAALAEGEDAVLDACARVCRCERVCTAARATRTTTRTTTATTNENTDGPWCMALVTSLPLKAPSPLSASTPFLMAGRDMPLGLRFVRITWLSGGGMWFSVGVRERGSAVAPERRMQATETEKGGSGRVGGGETTKGPPSPGPSGPPSHRHRFMHRDAPPCTCRGRSWLLVGGWELELVGVGCVCMRVCVCGIGWGQIEIRGGRVWRKLQRGEGKG